MTFDHEQLEAITQSVLRELRSRGVDVAAMRSASPKAASGVVTPTVSLTSGDHLNMGEMVITEDTLRTAGAVGRTISIRSGAIITPSGQDYIRRHDVTVSGRQEATKTGAPGLLISVRECATAVSAAKAEKWNLVSADSDFAAARQARAAASDRPVVCCSSQPAVAACVLNREQGIRAAVVTRSTDLPQLWHLMNPQVVCLEPAGWSFTEVLGLFRQAAAAQPTVPADWRELSGEPS